MTNHEDDIVIYHPSVTHVEEVYFSEQIKHMWDIGHRNSEVPFIILLVTFSVNSINE